MSLVKDLVMIVSIMMGVGVLVLLSMIFITSKLGAIGICISLLILFIVILFLLNKI